MYNITEKNKYMTINLTKNIKIFILKTAKQH